MPKPTSKSRQELRSRFVRNAIPTEADFADLIAASLNQADDGVLKLPDQPLGLVRQKPDQPVLRFFADPAAEGSVWQVQLGAGDKPGFGLAAADGKLALFVDGATGNVGIGTTTPGFKLDVNGSVRLGGFTTEEKVEWPNVIWCQDLGKGWDEGLIKHGKEKGFFGRAGFGVHIHESRSFEMFSSGWQTLFGVEGGTGNTSIRGQTTILTSSNPIRFSSKWSGFPDDKTHGAEICNDTDFYKTLMIVGNKSASDTKGPRRVSIWDTLEVNGTLRIQNPVGWGKDGNLALFVDGVTGKVGMGTSDPASKLNIIEPIGTAASSNSGTLLLDHEDAGGASSIVFRSKVNRGSDHAFIEFRDKNPLINDGEAALLTIGMQNDINDHIALMPSGNVGVGTTTPTCKLDVNGDAYISGCLGIRAGSEIFFSGYGQIRSLDDSHRILFRKDENKMELREKGDIIFSSGSTGGQETSKMVIHGSGNVGIGTISPVAKLQVTGNVSITSAEGQNYACKSNFMAAGSLTIGGCDRNYGGGRDFNNNTAGLLLETLENTEIAVHDAGTRLASFMYYEGLNNSFTIGRDMGWGAISRVNVQGGLKVNGKVDSQNARIQSIANNSIRIDKDNWTDMPAMTVTADIDGAVLVLFKTGGVQAYPGKLVRARFRLLIDNNEKAFTLHEFHNEGWELRDSSLMWLESSLAAGNHEFKVQWRAEAGTVCACLYSDLRSLIVVRL